jgi:hypothetical protein
MPTTSPAEAQAVLAHLRRKGWSEEKLAEQILPYMPPPQPPSGDGGDDAGVEIPPDVSSAWLDEHLPAMDRYRIRSLVDELERRGWLPADAAVAVLPHLLPKLPPDDAQAILASLRDIGLSEDQIRGLTAARSSR